MYDSGTISSGVIATSALAATGIATGLWWIIVAAVGLAVVGLVLIRLSSRKAITRTPIASWDDLDDAPGIDADSWK